MKPIKFEALDPNLLAKADEDFFNDRITLEEYLQILSKPDDYDNLIKLMECYESRNFNDADEMGEFLCKDVFEPRPDLLLHKFFAINDEEEFAKSLQSQIEHVFKYGTLGIVKGFLTVEIMNCFNSNEVRDEIYPDTIERDVYLETMLMSIFANSRDGRLIQYVFTRFDPARLSSKITYDKIYEIKHPQTLDFLLTRVFLIGHRFEKLCLYEKMCNMYNICGNEPEFHFATSTGIAILKLLFEKGFPLSGDRKEIIIAYKEYQNRLNLNIHGLYLLDPFDVFDDCLRFGNVKCLKMIVRDTSYKLRLKERLTNGTLYNYISQNRIHVAHIWKFCLEEFGMRKITDELNVMIKLTLSSIDYSGGWNPQYLISIAILINLNVKLDYDMKNELRLLTTNPNIGIMFSKFYLYLDWLPHTRLYFYFSDINSRMFWVFLCLNRQFGARKTEWRDVKWLLGKYIHRAEQFDLQVGALAESGKNEKENSQDSEENY